MRLVLIEPDWPSFKLKVFEGRKHLYTFKAPQDECGPKEIEFARKYDPPKEEPEVA